jgi:hypothetical protein
MARRNEISMRVGQLFVDRSQVNLHSDMLDTPAFFWDVRAPALLSSAAHCAPPASLWRRRAHALPCQSAFSRASAAAGALISRLLHDNPFGTRAT